MSIGDVFWTKFRSSNKDIFLKKNEYNGDSKLISFGIFKKKYLKVDPTVITILHGAYLSLPERGKAIVDDKGCIVHSQIMGKYDTLLDVAIESIVPDLHLKNVVEYDATLFDLTSEGSALYSFWMLEALPKLKLYEIVHKEIENIKIIVNAKTNFVTETLNILGYGACEIIVRNNNDKIIKANRILSVTNPRLDRYTQSWAVDYLTESFTSEIEKTNKNRKVFISRQNARSRKIINWDECVEVLKKHDVDIIDTGSMSMQETVNILSESNIVIGEHGAGLTNIVFCKKGSNVIELFGAHYTTQYRLLAEVMEHKYVALYCQGANDCHNDSYTGVLSLLERNVMDMSVDTCELDKLLTDMITDDKM